MTTAKSKASASKSPMPTQTRRASREGGGDQQQKRASSERISADLEQFRKAGGRVEKLGTTRVLTRVDAAPEPVVAKPVATKAARAR